MKRFHIFGQTLEKLAIIYQKAWKNAKKYEKC